MKLCLKHRANFFALPRERYLPRGRFYRYAIGKASVHIVESFDCSCIKCCCPFCDLQRPIQHFGIFRRTLERRVIAFPPYNIDAGLGRPRLERGEGLIGCVQSVDVDFRFADHSARVRELARIVIPALAQGLLLFGVLNCLRPQIGVILYLRKFLIDVCAHFHYPRTIETILPISLLDGSKAHSSR
jgi:hypothetical protein